MATCLLLYQIEQCCDIFKNKVIVIYIYKKKFPFLFIVNKYDIFKCYYYFLNSCYPLIICFPLLNKIKREIVCTNQPYGCGV